MLAWAETGHHVICQVGQPKLGDSLIGSGMREQAEKAAWSEEGSTLRGSIKALEAQLQAAQAGSQAAEAARRSCLSRAKQPLAAFGGTAEQHPDSAGSSGGASKHRSALACMAVEMLAAAVYCYTARQQMKSSDACIPFRQVCCPHAPWQQCHADQGVCAQGRDSRC